MSDAKQAAIAEAREARDYDRLAELVAEWREDWREREGRNSRNWKKSNDRYAGIAAELQVESVAVDLAERVAARARDVDFCNDLRDEVWPIVCELDEGLDNMRARREYEEIYQRGREVAERLSPSGAAWNHPFVSMARVVSSMTEGGPTTRPKSVPEAAGLVDENGERLYIK